MVRLTERKRLRRIRTEMLLLLSKSSFAHFALSDNYYYRLFDVDENNETRWNSPRAKRTRRSGMDDRSPPSEQQCLLSLPNEVLLHIISYLQPTDNLAAFLKALVFLSHYQYHVDASRSYSLRSLTQTCGRLHTLTEPLLSQERTLERDTLQRYKNEMGDCENGSSSAVEVWLRDASAPPWNTDTSWEDSLPFLECQASDEVTDPLLPALPPSGQLKDNLLGQMITALVMPSAMPRSKGGGSD